MVLRFTIRPGSTPGCCIGIDCTHDPLDMPGTRVEPCICMCIGIGPICTGPTIAPMLIGGGPPSRQSGRLAQASTL